PPARAAAWLAAVHPEDRDGLVLALAGAARSGAAVEVRHRVAGPDGALRVLSGRFAPAGDRDETSGVRRYAGLIADVTTAADGEGRLARVLDAVEDVVVEAVREPEGWAVGFATAGLARIVGAPVPEVPAELAAMVRGLLPPEQRARLAAELDAVAARGDSSSVVVRVVRPDGGSRWLRVTAARTGTRDGRVVVGAVVRDITELRRAREGLRVALESVSDIVREARLRPDGTWELLYLSAVAERLLGRPLPESAPERLAAHAAAVHPDDAADLDARARAVVSQGVPDTLVYRVLRPDGEMRWVRAALSPLDDGAGGVGLTEVATDVSDLVAAGGRAGDARLEGVIAGIGEAVYELRVDDAGGRLTYASPRMWSIIGVPPPPTESALAVWDGAVHPRDRQRADDAMARALEGVPLTVDLRMVRPDGEIRTVRLTARPRLLPDGATLVAGTVADVTGEPAPALPLALPAPPAGDGVRPAPAEDCPLTERQLAVLRLIGEGAGTEEVARRLGIRSVTVANHVAAVLRRLEARSRLEAVAKARQAGYIR
ncbi:MAG TPA: PAS domain-containing protein, partial [Miltoncostaeaceae bacterium]|nr:PAS domain-containing protein [Miltoncostaeaceae bacterium]